MCELQKQICKLYVNDNLSIRNIAKLLKKGRVTITSILKENNIKIIPKKRSKALKYKYFCRLNHELKNPADICGICGEVLDHMGLG